MKYHSIRKLAETYQLILGSSSPRRKYLLGELDVPFKQLKPNIAEIQNLDEDPYKFAERLAAEKALSLINQLAPNQLVIGCDTIVVLENKVLGKPSDKNIAFETLSKLSGLNHTVCTAVALADGEGLIKSGYELTRVFFNQVSPKQITDYIETGEPMDKAGAYGIQGMGAFLVDRIEGNLDNVIGFPLDLLEQLSGDLLTAQNNGKSKSDQ